MAGAMLVLGFFRAILFVGLIAGILIQFDVKEKEEKSLAAVGPKPADLPLKLWPRFSTRKTELPSPFPGP
jgi:hypothetical protein